MTTATKQEALSAAMALAFAEIEAATKQATNPHFKSKYADLGAVIDAIKPALIKHGLFFTQRPLPSEGGVCLETVLHHSSGDSMALGQLFVPANKNDAQGFGSALTYARRYGLMTAFGVPAEDDDGNAAAKSAPAQNGASREDKKDAPFPPGPAKNKTELKTLGAAFWREVEGCGDPDELAALLASHSDLQRQISQALPIWWNGGTHDSGEPYDGLGTLITKKQGDLAVAAMNAG